MKKIRATYRGVIAATAAATALIGGSAFAGAASAASVQVLPAASVLAGHTLKAGQSIFTETGYPNGEQYRVVMQPDGNLVEYGNGRALWSTKTNGHAGAYFVMQSDNNAVVYSSTGKALWNSHTVKVRSTAGYLLISIDGTVAVSDTVGNEVWQNGRPGADVLSAPDIFRRGMYIASRPGGSVLEMQSDGNLVAYKNGKAVWSSGTAGNQGAYLAIQTDGNVVVYSAAGKALWNTHTAGTGAGNLFALHTDGTVNLTKGATTLWKAP